MTNLARRSALAIDALGARDGANLFRYSTTTPVALKASKLAADGTVVVKGIDVLKVGTYKGLSLGSFELETMAARHTDLRDGGVFLPPFRLDHSFSVMSVIGWVEELYTEAALDATTGVEVLFLRADVRFTGSLDYSPEQILDAIRSGALRNRSSELGPYVTNQGEELPLVFYGCAFVDVPAVEGLAPIALARTRHAGPAAVIELAEGDTVDPLETPDPAADEAPVEETPEQDAPELEEDAEETDEDVPPVVPATPPLEPGEATALEADAARQDLDAHDNGDEPAAPVAVPDEEIVDGPEGGEDAPADTPEGESPDEPAAEPETPAEGVDLRAPGGDELARLRSENLRLRTEQTTRDLETFTARGVIVPLNRPAAVTLLSHDDEAVRASARALLAGVPSVAALDTVRGRQTLSAALSAATGTTSPGGDEPARIELGMTPDEVGALWASLSTAQRADRQAELEAWEKARRNAAAL